ncbi:MAG: (2Fe-2S)-binding protein [Xanthobacteraceae bacterium]
MQIRMNLNHEPVQVEVQPRVTLADCLRHQLGKTGTHLACEHGVCGACTVIVNGNAVRSCLMLAVQAEGAEVVTVEGLTPDDEDFGPLQHAFRKHNALQCGFCTSGMLTTAHALLTAEPEADRDRIRSVIAGNICRCTGYLSIVDAIHEAGEAYRANKERA